MSQLLSLSNSIKITMQHIAKNQNNKYIANTAENSFRACKVLIISWVYRYNCTVTEISKKRTIQRYLYSPPGRTERQRPAYGGFFNAIVCVSYRQHPIMAEEMRSQERGSHEGENLRGEGKAPLERLPLFPWVVSLTHSSNVIAQNSEPEKCYPTKSTIGSLLSMLITKTA